MENIRIEFTQNEFIPAIIYRGENHTPVWIQKKWQDGEYSDFINRNGCGHCCVAMALNLNGIKINPHEEFTLCRKKWGDPKYGEPLEEDNFHSAAGIVKIIKSFEIKAECFGVKKNKANVAAKRIETALKCGKLVIFWSAPSGRLNPNPFSKSNHYVLACDISEDGQITIANSSTSGATENGIQYTDIKTIEKALPCECEPYDFTWGRYDLPHSGGYIIIG